MIKSERKLLKIHKELRNLNRSSPKFNKLADNHQEARRQHHQLLRFQKKEEGFKRDRTVNALLSSTTSSSAFKTIKHLKNTKAAKVGKLTVGKLTYLGDTVPDGIYESIRSLKTDPVVRDVAALPDLEEDYRNILDICKS